MSDGSCDVRPQPDESIDYKLDTNAVHDLVKYVRSSTIRNEQQFVLSTLGYLTGFFDNPDHFVSGVIIGTSSSGKTHFQNQIENLYLEDSHLYQMTGGTDKALVYDETWDDFPIASLDELQKPPKAVIEFLKSCFTPDTDVLTPNGVRSIRDLEMGDLVYSINPDTEEIETKPVVDIIEKPNYDGNLVEWHGDNVSMRMTPDHGVLRYKGDRLVREPASDLTERATFQLPVHEPLDGPGVSDTVDIRDECNSDVAIVTDTNGTEYVTAGEKHGWTPRYIDRDDWIEFVGWYVTEGSTRRNAPPYQIQITQDGIGEIASLCDRMGISYSRFETDDGGDQIVITNKILHEVLRTQFGSKSQNKRLPGWVFDMSVGRKMSFFRTMMDGDGSGDTTYYTTSEHLRDDMLCLATEIGRVPSYRDDSNAAPNSDNYWRLNVTRDKQWVNNEQNLTRMVSSDVDTNGVYCVEVADNHTLMVGRNGRFSHTGNCHGGDERFIYKQTEGSVKSGFEANEIVRKAKPYWFLYAQYDSDFEMWNRLLKVPVHESTSKNKAVGAMEFDHDEISIEADPEDDTEYGFEFDDGEQQIKTHIAYIHNQIQSGDLPGHVHLPTGDEYGWDVWEIMKPIFNHDRTESNRIYGMVSNLVRASALMNYRNRDVEEITHSKYGTIDAIIAEPQDVANILSCRDVLVSTTHGLDDKRWAICDAIDSKGGEMNEVEGVSPITDYLRTTDAPLPPESELEKLIEDLSNNYLIDIHPGAGNKGRDIYEFLGYDQLGFAKVPENRALFTDTFDPVSGRPFLEVHAELRDELESRGDDMMTDSDPSSTGSQTAHQSSSSSGGDLSSYGGGTGRDVDLEEHEEAVRASMHEHLDGVRIENMSDVPVEGLVGLTDPNDPDPSVDVDGTVLDPDDEIWVQPDKSDEWVTDVKDTTKEVRRAIRHLFSERVVTHDEVHERNEEGKPIDVTISVLSESDL